MLLWIIDICSDIFFFVIITADQWQLCIPVKEEVQFFTKKSSEYLQNQQRHKDSNLQYLVKYSNSLTAGWAKLKFNSIIQYLLKRLFYKIALSLDRVAKQYIVHLTIRTIVSRLNNVVIDEPAEAVNKPNISLNYLYYVEACNELLVFVCSDIAPRQHNTTTCVDVEAVATLCNWDLTGLDLISRPRVLEARYEAR